MGDPLVRRTGCELARGRTLAPRHAGRCRAASGRRRSGQASTYRGRSPRHPARGLGTGAAPRGLFSCPRSGAGRRDRVSAAKLDRDGSDRARGEDVRARHQPDSTDLSRKRARLHSQGLRRQADLRPGNVSQARSSSDAGGAPARASLAGGHRHDSNRPSLALPSMRPDCL
jgi:hypothetical protein